ncbi:hypothetical protein BECAL_03056 [Bellilinea caldifistulae]|uniref:Uncharacterized protein n=1 Tax=Bellilinea caldifistulae TaxID=360411 RepID=A0A0P6X989_9CHLR|nr:hypothetical protein [Bellilinea caldifistulae]KPL70931.1 hypothetical protein AC812_16530 [Bellilinea caldifistulae]GAP11862.1 hypothetical protein BECAL_03056 [Bellilinea caldifistulae]
MHLHEWETYLEPYLSQIQLLGEIPLSREQHAELEIELEKWIRRYGLTQATRNFGTHFPAVFVTYLSFKAAFNDERSFWDKVAEAFEIDHVAIFHPNHHWGRLFREIIQQYPNLRDFRNEFEEGYINPIRLHGGIPAYSLADFFQHILLPSVQKPPYKDLEDGRALEELLNHYTAELFVDDVVRHFFQYGGEPAQRFFSKCRQMAREAVQGNPIPDAATLGIRPYVVQAFEHFWQNRAELSIRRRLPRLYFDPYAPGLNIQLPAQPISSEEQSRYVCFFWRIRLVDSTQPVGEEGTLRLRVRRSGSEVHTDEVSYQPETLAPYAEISFVGQSEEGNETTLFKRSLRLLPSSEVPVFAFRYRDNSACSLNPVIPAETLWLFYPADAELLFSGSVHEVEHLHPFPPPLDNWQSQAWDLRNASLIRLQRQGQDVCPPLPVRWTQEPKIVGILLPQSLPIEEKPVYLGSPGLELPVHDFEHLESELSRWKIHLQSRFAANPQGKWEYSAGDFPGENVPENNVVRLSLHKVLGEAPCGTFHLTIQRGNSFQAELPFRVLPSSIQVEDLHPYYLPDWQGAKDVQFSIRLPEGFSLSLLEDSEAEIQNIGDRWQINVPAEDEQVALQIEKPTEKEIIRVPFKIEIPHLKWSLELISGKPREWQDKPLSLSLAKILQSDNPRLFLKIPSAMELDIVELHLTDDNENETLQVQPPQQTYQRELVFQLNAFHDTLRSHSRASILYFILKMQFNEQSIELPVLQAHRDLNIQKCEIEILQNRGRRLHWFEPEPLRQRYVRIWGLWQPWSDPIQIPVPDDLSPSTRHNEPGWWQMDIPKEYSLPPSQYRLQFVAMGRYDLQDPPPRPPENSILIEMVSPPQRLDEIEEQLQIHPQRSFALHLEKACIYHSQKNASQLNHEIQWLCSNWSSAPLRLLYFLQDWLAEIDPSSRKAILLNMFRKETLLRLQQDSDKNFVQRYLDLVVNARTLNPESAYLVTGMSKNPLVMLRALEVLIKNSDSRGLDILQNYLQQGKISEEGAANVLLANPEFSFPFLREMPDSPIRWRLLGFFSAKHSCPDLVVHKGYWVLSDAGWGKIVKIEGSSSNDYFLLEKEKPRLHIVLREEETREETSIAEEATIDLEANELSFIGRNAGQICTKCKRFITCKGIIAWERHRHTTQHQYDTFPIVFPYKMTLPLRFSVHSPQDVFSDKE